MKHRFLPQAIGLLVAVGLLIPGLAAAQGNGRPKRPKAPAPTTTTPAPTSSSPSATTTPAPASTSAPSSAPTSDPLGPVSVTSFREFGAWLDDASAPTRGEGYSSISVGHWRMSGMSQTNAPMLGAGVGLTDRMQVSASVPFYHVSVDGGTASTLT